MRDELERESTCPVSGLRESGSGGTAAVGVEFQPQGRRGQICPWSLGYKHSLHQGSG